MPILSSVAATPELEELLMSTPDGWKLVATVLERTEPLGDHDDDDDGSGGGGGGGGHRLTGEWAPLLIQHLVKSTRYEKLYNGLSQIVTSDAVACADAGNAAAAANTIATDQTARDVGHGDGTAGQVGQPAKQRGSVGDLAAEVRRGEVAKLALVKWTWGIVLDALSQMDGESEIITPVLAPTTVDFIAERYGLFFLFSFFFCLQLNCRCLDSSLVDGAMPTIFNVQIFLSTRRSW